MTTLDHATAEAVAQSIAYQLSGSEPTPEDLFICPDCQGQGDHVTQFDVDDWDRTTCNRCGGNGQL